MVETKKTTTRKKKVAEVIAPSAVIVEEPVVELPPLSVGQKAYLSDEVNAVPSKQWGILPKGSLVIVKELGNTILVESPHLPETRNQFRILRGQLTTE